MLRAAKGVGFAASWHEAVESCAAHITASYCASQGQGQGRGAGEAAGGGIGPAPALGTSLPTCWGSACSSDSPASG